MSTTTVTPPEARVAPPGPRSMRERIEALPTWAGGLVGTTIRVRFWRRPAAEIPKSEDERTDWLYERWQELDDWVGEQRTREAAPP